MTPTGWQIFMLQDMKKQRRETKAEKGRQVNKNLETWKNTLLVGFPANCYYKTGETFRYLDKMCPLFIYQSIYLFCRLALSEQVQGLGRERAGAFLVWPW